jgi:hypothetical protein
MLEKAIIELIAEAVSKDAVRSGSVVKQVKCENCSGEYVYLLRRTATARAPCRQETVERQAEEKLKRLLQRGFEVVPCPVCGWYQKEMVARVREEMSRDVPRHAVILAVSSAPLYGLAALLYNAPPNPVLTGLALVLGLAAVVCLVSGFGLWIPGLIRSARFDPNAADQESRIRTGQSLALRKEELDKRAAEQVARRNEEAGL